MRLDIQLFGGRGASSSLSSSNSNKGYGSPKNASQLREMREKYLKKYESGAKEDYQKELLNDYKKAQFVAYNFEDNKISLESTYENAKNYADKGGQVLNLKTDKIYDYKVKSTDEYIDYVGKQVRSAEKGKKDKYGL